MKRLAVIPSDRIRDYLRGGFGLEKLEEYYNPGHFFEEVYLLSPLEKEARAEAGMKIIPTPPERLPRRIRELHIDLVRAYGGYWPCDMACRNRVNGVPVVVSVHDQRPEMLASSIRKADVVFCVSPSVKKVVGEKLRRAERIWILPNRVDLALMRPAGKARPDLSDRFPQRYRILHIGRKSPEKNLDTLIKALKILGGDFGLIAAGMGPVGKYAQLAEELGVRRQCYFPESIRNEELPEYYSWADCVCVPSRCEGFGIVFIEALACEAVVVTSDREPMNGYIRHMTNGLLVKEYENPFALAETIRWACTDRDLRMRLKANARRSVEKFEKGRIDALEAEYYRKILRMKGQGKFSMPLWDRVVSISGAGARGILPGPVRNTLRAYLFSENSR